jgi:2-iminobutanoate/2-iminopropanoate deaminase
VQYTNWVYTLVRALDGLGGEAHVSELEKSSFVREEQNVQLDLAATIRGSIHDYCSDHSSARSKGAREGNLRDVFQKIGPARWKIRSYKNPFVRYALGEIDGSKVRESVKDATTNEQSLSRLIKDIEVDAQVFVREHWRSYPSEAQPSTSLPIFHLIADGPRPVAPFSHAVEADGWVFLTGQMPTDPSAPDAALPDGIAAQTRRVMDNLGLVLEGIGLDWSHVLQCRCYLTAFERDFAAFNLVYQGYFPPDRRPARTTIGVTALAVGALVEVDCIARRPEAGGEA